VAGAPGPWGRVMRDHCVWCATPIEAGRVYCFPCGQEAEACAAEDARAAELAALGTGPTVAEALADLTAARPALVALVRAVCPTWPGVGWPDRIRRAHSLRGIAEAAVLEALAETTETTENNGHKGINHA